MTTHANEDVLDHDRIIRYDDDTNPSLLIIDYEGEEGNGVECSLQVGPMDELDSFPEHGTTTTTKTIMKSPPHYNNDSCHETESPRMNVPQSLPTIPSLLTPRQQLPSSTSISSTSSSSSSSCLNSLMNNTSKRMLVDIPLVSPISRLKGTTKTKTAATTTKERQQRKKIKKKIEIFEQQQQQQKQKQKHYRCFQTPRKRVGFILLLLMIVIGTILSVYITVTTKQRRKKSASNLSVSSLSSSSLSSSLFNETTTSSLSFNTTSSSLSPSSTSLLVSTIGSNSSLNSIPVNAVILPTTEPYLNISTTLIPSMERTLPPTLPKQTTFVTSFVALGDVPYNHDQSITLRQQMKDLVYDDLDFVIHVGDLRRSDRATDNCLYNEYQLTANILRLSLKPVFVLPGDNDYIDCYNVQDSWDYYNEIFVRFDKKYWNHTLDVSSHPNYPETFTFIHQRTLFIGLHLVTPYSLKNHQNNNNNYDDYDDYDDDGYDDDDGSNQSIYNWYALHSEQANWTMNLIDEYRAGLKRDNKDEEEEYVGRIVLMGHADPSPFHADYFDPITEYIGTVLRDDNDSDSSSDDDDNNRRDGQHVVPVLYLNGDTHKWEYQTNFMDQSNLVRITLAGRASEAPTLLRVYGNGQSEPTDVAYQYERRS